MLNRRCCRSLLDDDDDGGFDDDMGNARSGGTVFGDLDLLLLREFRRLVVVAVAAAVGDRAEVGDIDDDAGDKDMPSTSMELRRVGLRSINNGSSAPLLPLLLLLLPSLIINFLLVLRDPGDDGGARYLIVLIILISIRSIGSGWLLTCLLILKLFVVVVVVVVCVCV